MPHAKFLAVCLIEPALLLIEVLHCGIGIFDLCCFCDLDPMIFIHELDPYLSEIYRI